MTVLIPSDSGDEIVRSALKKARETAALDRDLGLANEQFMRGLLLGQIIIASAYLRADPILRMAATNEIRFLLGNYLKGAEA